MKNITLSVEEDVLAPVRKYAASRNTTVNGLVRDYLGKLATQAGQGRSGEKAAGRTRKGVHLRSWDGLEVEQGGVV